MDRQNSARAGASDAEARAAARAEARREGWAWVAEEVVSRRVALGFRQRADFAAAAGLSLRTVGDIENGRRISYDRTTIAAVEHVLQWPAGAISNIAQSALTPTRGVGIGRRREWQPDQLSATAEVVDRPDEALIRVMRSSLPDQKKVQLVKMLMAERESFEKQRSARAQDLIELFSDTSHVEP